MLRVHSYESMGTFDGPGLRFVVFLQGCNFRCLYCANPDTIDAEGESKPTSEYDILKQVTDMKPFFGKRGGVTFSGGEPTFQAAALVPLVKAIKEQGIHVCIDSNGGIWNPAVEELLKEVDLVLLDIDMPDMSGFEVLVSIRESIGVNIPVIMLTSNCDEASVLKCVKHGANDYTIKPIDEAVFMKKVEKYLK